MPKSYLVFAQCLNDYDKRYDTFFASILKNSPISLPKNIKIISWNYDFQIERAFAEYSGDYRMDSADSYLNINNKLSREDHGCNKDFSIFKINGTANIVQNFRTFPYTENLNSEFNRKSIETALNNYALLLFKNSNCYPALSFAWEDRDGWDNNIINKTKEATLDTNVLVVVGYSFPFFNRGIDREIIGNMKNLEKVYFQAPNAKDLIERFESIRPDIDVANLVPRFDIDQFLLPNEL